MVLWALHLPQPEVLGLRSGAYEQLFAAIRRTPVSSVSWKASTRGHRSSHAPALHSPPLARWAVWLALSGTDAMGFIAAAYRGRTSG